MAGQRRRRLGDLDGDGAPAAQAADGTVIAAEPGTDPEEIAGSLADFVDAVRTGRIPSGEGHSNVLSLAMVEAAIRSAEEGRRVTVAEVLDDAYVSAVQAEEDPEIRAVLAGWTSVHDAVGVAAASRRLAATGAEVVQGSVRAGGGGHAFIGGGQGQAWGEGQRFFSLTKAPGPKVPGGPQTEGVGPGGGDLGSGRTRRTGAA